MLNNFIGEKVRIVVYNKQNEPEIDLMCKHLDKESCNFFSQYKFMNFHKTKITGLNVITLVKE